jgi:hypothetical protein
MEEADTLAAWKSDIKGVYHVCPLHPFWQVKQGVQLGSSLHIDCHIAFGSSASPAIFITFNSLVTWIAKNKCGIQFILTYLDDSLGCTWKDDVEFYAPYGKHMPLPQVQLLTLWDKLGIPHEEQKQISGSSIPVIGIQVNPNDIMYMFPAESRQWLLQESEDWVTKGRRNVKCWQHLAGWVNWCLNVYPRLRLALCNVYKILRFQTNQNTTIWIKNGVQEDLQWVLSKIRYTEGLHLLDTL